MHSDASNDENTNRREQKKRKISPKKEFLTYLIPKMKDLFSVDANTRTMLAIVPPHGCCGHPARNIAVGITDD